MTAEPHSSNVVGLAVATAVATAIVGALIVANERAGAPAPRAVDRFTIDITRSLWHDFRHAQTDQQGTRPRGGLAEKEKGGPVLAAPDDTGNRNCPCHWLANKRGTACPISLSIRQLSARKHSLRGPPDRHNWFNLRASDAAPTEWGPRTCQSIPADCRTLGTKKPVAGGNLGRAKLLSSVHSGAGRGTPIKEFPTSRVFTLWLESHSERDHCAMDSRILSILIQHCIQNGYGFCPPYWFSRDAIAAFRQLSKNRINELLRDGGFTRQDGELIDLRELPGLFGLQHNGNGTETTETSADGAT